MPELTIASGHRSRPWTAATAAVLAVLLLWACSDRSSPSGVDPSVPVPFDTGTEGLPMAEPTREVVLAHGDTVRLAVGWVAKWISGKKVRMLAYNGQIPGPTLKVPQGAEVTVLLTNGIALPTSLHSHGIRMEYRSDGMPGISQAPVDSGRTYAYKLRFPDAGLFWYHPHVREDYGLELGLYGNFFVTPRDPAYWPPVNREILLVLDDVLLDDKGIMPFYRNQTTHAMMGRFGNVFLVNGDTDMVLHVKRNEMIRFFVTNVSGSRVFNLKFSRDMDLNVLGGDNGRFEYSFNTETEFVAPSERLIFQCAFAERHTEDTLDLLHWPSAPGLKSKTLLKVVYDEDTAVPDLRSSFAMVQSPQVKASIDSFRASFHKPLPDQEVLLWGYMGHDVKVATHEPDATNRLGIEWYDHMEAMNRATTEHSMKWFVQDVNTGKVNHAIDWKFRRGDQVLIRVRNDHDTLDPKHPDRMFHRMPHPIHFHGQRFLVVREKPPGTNDWEENKDGLIWKDSYLVGSGFTVDLLLDASNPGDWMFHCHIPEHLQSKMMGHFSVVDGPVPERTAVPWSLSLRFPDARFDSLRQDYILATDADGAVTGTVNGFDPSLLEASLHLVNTDNEAMKVTVPLGTDGSFSLQAPALLGTAPGRSRFKAFVKAKGAAYRPRPDTLRLAVDRRIKSPWTLDLDLGDAGAFLGLAGDTSATGAFDAEISGKVNGFDPAVFRDTVWFQLLEYPEQNLDFPLDREGRFSFDAFSLLGGQDGIITMEVLLKTRDAIRRPVPERITVVLMRTLQARD